MSDCERIRTGVTDHWPLCPSNDPEVLAGSGAVTMSAVSLRFAWYDLWVGAFWDRKSRTLYVCPLPTLLVTVRFGGAPDG